MGTEMGLDKLRELYLDDTSIECFHRNLSVLRKASGLSCKDMSDILGITRSTYNRIESIDKMSRMHYLAVHEALARANEANHEIVNIVRDIISLVDRGNLDRSEEQELQDCVTRVEKQIGKKRGSKILGEYIRVELYLWFINRNSSNCFSEGE